MRQLASAALRLAAALFVCTVALAVAGCGDSDQGTTAGSADRPAETASSPKAPADTAGDRPTGDDPQGREPEEQVAAVVEGMYADLAARDGEGVCSVMSSAARDQIAQQVPGGSTEPPAERTCAASMDKFIASAAASGVLDRTRAKVTKVAIAGDSATVTLSLAGRTGNLRVEKEGGRWVFGPGSVATSP